MIVWQSIGANLPVVPVVVGVYMQENPVLVAEIPLLVAVYRQEIPIVY